MENKKVISIIGTHGLYAKHGGFETLVANLVDFKSNDHEYIIFNSKYTEKPTELPLNIRVISIPLSASGKIGVIYDFLSILVAFFYSNSFLLLGSQGMPMAVICKIFKNISVTVNLDGMETERSSFSFFAKGYLKFCYKISYKFADKIILDNGYFKALTPKKILNKSYVIPYGAKIDKSLSLSRELTKKYSFLETEYFMALGRAINDNNLFELCDFFSRSDKNLVLVSVLDNNPYGKSIIDKFSKLENIIFINGLFNKPELDLIRSSCKGYIHTHSLCGTAPSLVEAICSNIPIISIDAPQNRFTLKDSCCYFKEFDELKKFTNLSKAELDIYKPNKELVSSYGWKEITDRYENLF